MRIGALCALALVVLVLVGCSEDPSPPPAPDPATEQQPVDVASSSGESACRPEGNPTLARFDTPKRLERVLRSPDAPLPFVTYGPLAQAKEGDENYRQKIRWFIPEQAMSRLPADQRVIYLQLFDADVGWLTRPDERRPWDDEPHGVWDTVTRFRLIGRDDAVLVEHHSKAGRDPDSDQRWMSWGPISLDCAERSDSGYSLALEVEGLEGNDGNAFLARLTTSSDAVTTPEGLRLAAAGTTFRLVEPERTPAELRFRIPESVQELIVHSFDLARGRLRLETALRSIPIEPSGQGDAVDVVTRLVEAEMGRFAALVFSGAGWEQPNDVTIAVWDQDRRPLDLELPAVRRGRPRVERPLPVRATSKLEDDCRTVVFNGSGPAGRREGLSFSWTLGDGTKAEGRQVTHSYAEPGTYEVHLAVRTDSDSLIHGGLETLERRIWARPVAQAGGDLVGEPGVALQLDGSASVDPDGGRLRYRWDFGDGASGRGSKVAHAWRRPGAYRVELTVEDDGEAPCNTAYDSVTVLINARPEAVAEAAEVAAAPRQPVAFDGSSSHDAEEQGLDYRWDFGDGGSARGAQVSHGYDRPGTYRATLTVTDPSGATNASSSDSVEIFVNSPPIPRVATGLPGCPDEESCRQSCELAVELQGSASSDDDGDRMSFRWDLGDGSEATGETIEHTYEDDGDYRVRLTVDDGRGLRNSKQTHELKVAVHRPPRASAGPARRTVSAGQPLLLSGAASTTSGSVALRYRWDFDEGQSDDGADLEDASWEPTTVHRFTGPGSEHTVRLAVIDESGFPQCQTGSTEIEVRVEESGR